VFRRRSDNETAATDAPVAAQADVAPVVNPAEAPKGRPTPSRREAQGARPAPIRTEEDRRAAAKAARAKDKEDRKKLRDAVMTGDEKNLPPRDAGPVRRYVRDIVDSRWNVGDVFLPTALVMFVAVLFTSAVPTLALVLNLLLMLLLVALILDSVLITRTVKRKVQARFPRESTRGLGSYAVLRSSQFRRFRLPPPKVKRGERV
jgi:hypothetical protein